MSNPTNLFHLTLLCILLFVMADTTKGRLQKLKDVARKCYSPMHCNMYMNQNNQFGCAQCQPVRSAPLLEITTTSALVIFLQPTSFRKRKIIMVPEFVFFEDTVVSALDQADNVAALLVYEGNSPDRQSTQGRPLLAYPPIDWPTSDDDTEPNRFHNFYNFNAFTDDSSNDFCLELGTRSSPNRNSIGTCRNFKFFPFNIFRLTAAEADEIRGKAFRFPDVDEASDLESETTGALEPRYKIESRGTMWACNQQEEIEPSEDSGSSGGGSNSTEDQGEPEKTPATSATCLSNGTCLPIGGHSVWSSLGQLRENKPYNPNKTILAIISPMDSSAFFPDLAGGAFSEMTSLAIVLALAETLGSLFRKVGNKIAIQRQPVFFAFNGQAWGYAGSDRFLMDLDHFNCTNSSKDGLACDMPYMPSLKFQAMKNTSFEVVNIGPMIRVNDTYRNDSKADELPEYYVHRPMVSGSAVQNNEDGDDEPDELLVKAFERAFENAGLEGDPVPLNRVTRNIPPDASQSFFNLRDDPNKIITLASYNESFNNAYYHSIYDNVTMIPEIDKKPMYAAAKAVLRGVIELVYGQAIELDSYGLRFEPARIDMFVSCLTQNLSKCEIAREYLGANISQIAGRKSAPANYAGPFVPLSRVPDMRPDAFLKLLFIRNFLAYQTRYNSGPKCAVPVDGDKDDLPLNSSSGCEVYKGMLNNGSAEYELHEVLCVRGTCIVSDTHLHPAFGSEVNMGQQNESSSSGRIAVNFTIADGDGVAVTYDPQSPRGGGWTESLWDRDIGICGYVEDTQIYGGLVLMAGLSVLAISLFVSFWLDKKLTKYSEKQERDASPYSQGNALL